MSSSSCNPQLSMRLSRMALSSYFVYSLLGSNCFALKLSPIQQQIHKVDISMESQLLQSAFKEAYGYLHSERLKVIAAPAQNIDIDDVSLALFIRKLKNSIDRWTILEEKLKSSVSVDSLATFKQAFDDANNNLAANKALLGQLLLMGKQEFLALQELQIACPILWDYDVSIRNQYFDGWIDCYASLGYIHSKIGNLDVAAEIEEELLLKMPWIRSVIPTTSTPGSAPLTTTLTRTTIEVSGPSVLKHLWSCSPIDRLSIADQTRRMWLTARMLRARLNDITGELLATSNKRRQLTVFMEAQEAVESELSVYTNRAASAAMVSDAVLGSANPPTIATLDNLSQHDLAAEIGEERFSQMLIKSWMAEMIKDFKRQIYREASHYLKAMDRFVEDGAISLAADKRVSIEAQSENAPPGAMEEYFGAPLGFQSREAIRITFEYLYSEFVERNLQDGKVRVSSSRSGSAGSKTKTASQSEASGSSDGKSSHSKNSNRNTSDKKFRRASRNKSQKSASEPTVTKSPNYASWIYASLVSLIAFVSGYVYWIKARLDAKNTAAFLDRELTQTSNVYGSKSPHRKRGKDSKSTLNSNSLFAAESIDFDHVPFVSPYQMIRRVFTRASTAVERSLPVYFRRRCMTSKANQADSASEVRQYQSKIDHVSHSQSHQPINNSPLTVETDITTFSTRSLSNTDKRLSSESRDELTNKLQQASKQKNKKAAKNKPNESTSKNKSVPTLPRVPFLPDCVVSTSAPVTLIDHNDRINFDMETDNHTVVEAGNRSSSPAGSDGEISHESHDSGETDHEVAGVDDKLVSTDSHFDDILQIDENSNSGDWIELSNTNNHKNNKMKKITEKSLSFEERREKAVQEYRLKQEIERRLLDVAQSMPKARLPRNQIFLNTASSSKTKVVSPSSPLPMHSAGASPTQPQPATASVLPVVNSNADIKDTKNLKLNEEADVNSKPTKPHLSTKRFISNSSPSMTKQVSTSASNRSSKNVSYTTANNYKHKQPKTLEASPSSPPKTVNYSINLMRTDVEDGSVESDCMSSVTGDNQLSSATTHADSLSQNQLQSAMVPYHIQPIEMMSQYMPHALVPQTDAYGNVTNQNYIIMSQSADGLVTYPMQMPMYQPMPVQTSASTSQVVDAQIVPSQQSVQQQQQFYFYPQPVPMQTAQVPMAYNYQYYSQQLMPVSQQNTQNTSRPHSVSPTLPNLPDGSQFSSVLDAVRQQIEYYFSIENLSRDVYLRGKLDEDGFVDLEEISQFRRIRQMRVTAHQIFEAIFSSSKLELQENSVVIAARSNPEVFATLSEAVVLQTKVRTVEDRSLWNFPLATPSCPSSPRVSGAESNSSDRNAKKVESPHNFTPIQNVTISYQRAAVAVLTSSSIVTSSKTTVAPTSVDSSDVTTSQ